MLKSILCIIIMLASLFMTDIALAQKKISVVALFQDHIVIQVDGEYYRLRVGEIGPENIQLIESDSVQATIKTNDEVQTFKLGELKALPYQSKEDLVSIRPNARGMYLVDGKINNSYVEFLVDTGATHIAMNIQQAERLKLPYKNKGAKAKVETANGLADAYVVTLRKVSIDSIVIYDVEALIIQGKWPTNVLLGMSFLESLQMHHKGNVLQLKKIK